MTVWSPTNNQNPPHLNLLLSEEREGARGKNYFQGNPSLSWRRGVPEGIDTNPVIK